MNNLNLKTFELLQAKWDFEPDELIKIHTLMCAGHELMSAGISTWHIIRGKLGRHTEQLRIPGMCLILDDTFLWDEIMSELYCIQEDLATKGSLCDLDRCLYVVTRNTHTHNIQTHFFTRVSIPELTDSQDVE